MIDGEDGDKNDKAVVAAAILTINNIKNYKFIRCLARKGSGGGEETTPKGREMGKGKERGARS